MGKIVVAVIKEKEKLFHADTWQRRIRACHVIRYTAGTHQEDDMMCFDLPPDGVRTRIINRREKTLSKSEATKLGHRFPGKLWLERKLPWQISTGSEKYSMRTSDLDVPFRGDGSARVEQKNGLSPWSLSAHQKIIK